MRSTRALDMVEELGRLNARWKAEGRPELDIGIGINTGPMIAGNIGSEAIMSYTVIGDAVNLGLAARVAEQAVRHRIIISEATREQLTGRYVIRPLGDVVVKGKTKPVAIFEVVGRDAAGGELHETARSRSTSPSAAIAGRRRARAPPTRSSAASAAR